MKTVYIMAAVGACMLGGSASAQTQPGHSQTLDVYTYEKTNNGNLNACEIVFQHALEDYAYNQGGLDYLSGSVTLTKRSGPLRITYKLVVEKVNKDATDKPSFQPASPTHIMLIGNSGRSHMPAKTVYSETPGGLLAAYPLEDVGEDIVSRILKKNEIGVAYNYGDAGTDVRATIDLNKGSDDHPGANAVKDFMICADKMYQDLKKAAE